jgi:low molecular weight protein-tyrosine phosphatase
MTSDATLASAKRSAPVRVLFVCLGNICRSPTAEGVFRRYVQDAGLAERILIDSAGTGDYHIGDSPDERACEAASRRGYDLSKLRARQIGRDDFGRFDYVLAMDEENLRTLKRLAPAEYAHKLKMFTDFSSKNAQYVPDPYAGGPQGFELVLDLVEDAAQGLLRHIQAELGD